MTETAQSVAGNDYEVPPSGPWQRLYSAIVWIVILGGTFPTLLKWLLGAQREFNNVDSAQASLTFLILAPAAAIGFGRWLKIVRLGKWWDRCIALLPLLLIVSAAWSELPAMAVEQGVGLLISILSGLGVVGLTWGTPHQWTDLAWASSVPVVGSVIAVWSGSEGSVLRGDWQGFFANPNHLAGVATLSSVASLLAIIQVLHIGVTRRSTWVSVTLITTGCIAILVSIKTGGQMAQIVIALVYGALPVRYGLRRWGHSMRSTDARTRLMAWATGLTAVTVTLWVASIVTSRIDWTFTRRNLRWQASLDGMLERPVTGWGFHNAWFTEKFRVELPAALSTERWSHSTWLDVGLALGIVGLVVFLSASVIFAIDNWIQFWNNPHSLWRFSFSLAAAAFFSLESLTFATWHFYTFAVILCSFTEPRTTKADSNQISSKSFISVSHLTLSSTTPKDTTVDSAPGEGT